MTPSKPLAGIVAGSLLLSGFSASPALAEIAVRAAQPGRTVAVAPVAPISALPGLGLEASLSLPSAADLSYPAIGVPALEATAALPAVSREPASVAPVAAEAAVLQAAPAPPAASRTSAPPRAVAAAQAKEQGQRGSGAPTLFAALSRPSLMTGPVAAASAESAGGLAERDFLLHAGADPGGSPESSFIEETAASRTGGLSRAAESPERARSEPQAPEAPEVPRYRSALFASVMAAAFSAVFAAVVVLPVAVDRLSAFFFPGADAQAFGAPAAGWAIGPVAAVIGIVAAAFSALAAWDIGLFLTAVGRGNVSEREFWEYARREIPQWNLHPSVTRALLGPKPGTGVLKLYRPAHRIRDFSFGFALGGAIYMRPELIRIPWLFRQVVKHELAHYEDHFERGPPVRSRWMIVRAFQYLRSELRAHFGELRTLRGMRAIRVPVLQRILQEAQLSLKLGSNYDLLLASGGEPAAGSALAAELSDPKAYAVVSGSQARVIRPEGDVGAFLGQAANQRRFRVAVYTSSHAALPDRGTPQGKRLAQALGQLDQIYRLSVRLSGLDTEGLRRSEREVRGLQRLAGDLGVQSRRINTPERIQAAIAEMYRRAARTQFQGLDFVERLQGLFDSVQHRGTLLLPFDAGDPGLDEAERILRYWQAPDGGRFLTERVDLPEGGHILVARKAEARVQLWLRPVRGRSVARSQTNFPAGPEGVEPQRALLRDAGFDEAEIARFERAGMIVRHVFGDDVGEGRVFVSVLRSHAKALKKYAEESRIHLEASRADFTVHLNQAGPIQNIGKAWKLGVEGEGGKIFDIDTGLDTTHPDFADRLLECIDFVGEGPEDWVGHGTHKAGISYSSGRIYRGMAPKALGRMGKVFSRSGFGASDGDIMAAAVEALKWGADVVSLSLGSPGSPDAPLA
ncbi:MAG TPA: S8 family serine peptidase, partial [Elusimicrobiota bacterium]|nr:S8 family serine peptidase [Elusimicrobiota bacterium]